MRTSLQIGENNTTVNMCMICMYPAQQSGTESESQLLVPVISVSPLQSVQTLLTTANTSLRSDFV